MIQKEFKTTPEYVVLNVDEEQKYTMGVYLCLNDTNIHNLDIKDAVDFKTIKSFENIQNENHSFIYFSSSSHKIKKKAEQTACRIAIELIQNIMWYLYNKNSMDYLRLKKDPLPMGKNIQKMNMMNISLKPKRTEISITNITL